MDVTSERLPEIILINTSGNRILNSFTTFKSVCGIMSGVAAMVTGPFSSARVVLAANESKPSSKGLIKS